MGDLVYDFTNIMTATDLGGGGPDTPFGGGMDYNDMDNFLDHIKPSETVDLNASGAVAIAAAAKLAEESLGRRNAASNTTQPSRPNSVQLPIPVSTQITHSELRSLQDINLKEDMTIGESLTSMLSDTMIKGIVTTIIIVAVSLIVAAIIFREKHSWIPRAEFSITAAVVSLAVLFVIVKMVKNKSP